jgi:hypothetical protein
VVEDDQRQAVDHDGGQGFSAPVAIDVAIALAVS